MERAGQEMHSNIEKLKAAKEYLAQKLNDAQTRIGSASVPVAGVTADGLGAEAVTGSWTTMAGLSDISVGTSGPLRPPAAAWSSQPLEEEAIENSNVPLHAPSRREGAVAFTPPPLSPSLSAGNSLEDGAGSYLAGSLVGSAVIMEDLETLELRRNQMQNDEVARSFAVDDAPIKTELEAASKSPNEVDSFVQLGSPSGRDDPRMDGSVAGATVISVSDKAPDALPPIMAASAAKTSSDSRLLWTSNELSSCRDELNSAVNEATSLRLSEAAVSERSSEAVDRLRAVAGLTTEEVPTYAPSRAIINDDQDEVMVKVQPADSQPPPATLEVPSWPASVKTDLEVAQQRIAELEALTQELEADRKAAHERIESLEARNLELETKLQAQPSSLTAELEERLAATRLQSEEVMKECEHRQETLEAMESRLQQAERMVLQPTAASVGGVVGSGVSLLGTTSQRSTMLAANGAAGEGATLDAARERVKLLYDQLMTRNVQVDSADGTSAVQRLGAAAQAPVDKQSLASTLMSIAASIQPPPAPASNASGISTPTAVLDASRRTQEPAAQPIAPQPASSQPAVLAMMTPKTRNLEVVPAPVTKTAPVSIGSSLSVSTLQPAYGEAASPGPLSPQSTPKFLAASPPHVEVRRFKQNVDDLQSLVLQMVGDKTRTASGLERKVAELENMVEQVGKGNSFTLERPFRSPSLDTNPPYLVGSISSTATLSPSRMREVVSSSPHGSLGSPGPRGIRPTRTSSPASTAGSAAAVRHLYRHSPSPTPGVTSVRQAATSPSPMPRRAVTPSPVRAVMSGRSVVTSRAPSRQPSLPTSRAATPLSRAASPAPVRSSSTASTSSRTTVSGPVSGSYAWQIPSTFGGGAMPGPMRMTGQAIST
mmetsp:Transcript_121465/g.222540  ORF Transcript_121465/g.222540 Transcript_121465/m.222540 type:complete len:885 (-) Transcript_121465:224-2878(-)